MSHHSEPPVETGADDIHAAPRRTGMRWFDLVMALSAIFISAVSLAIAIDNSRAEHNLVAASSWPFLRALYSNGYHGDVALGVSNGGVGPAKLDSFQLFYKGQAVASNLDLLRRCCGLGSTTEDVMRQVHNKMRYSVVDRTVMRAGEVQEVVGVRQDTEVGQRLADALPDIAFRVCYCSILDQCWVSSLQDTRVTEVKACPEPRRRFVPNARH